MVLQMQFDGEEKLKQNTGRRRESKITWLTDSVICFQYYGASNATLIIGETSCILVDTTESDGYAQAIKEKIKLITDKQVKTIIYTHSHIDHTGGAAVFGDTVSMIIGHTSHSIAIKHQDLLQEIMQKRVARQFGIGLSLEESISMGLNPALVPNGSPEPLPVTRYISEDRALLTIDGIQLELIAAPGETDDQQAVWLPNEQILCGGDNYYASWPNLSALRGGTYRDVAQWVVSLERYLELSAEILIPGHGELLVGAKKIQEVIGNYHDAIEWVLIQTLQGINNDLAPDDLVQMVRLPSKWADLPYLQEYYGTVAWSVRGIYDGYIGWFDGNPTNIGSMPIQKRAKKLLALMGGATIIVEEIARALAVKEMQWVMELCDVLLAAGTCTQEAKQWKAQACIYLGRMQTSANGRHYYLVCAKNLMK
ncbi:MAG: alkyl/aryl-sulfatase [Peptococcaceae bacterium]|nr:alkyl/aryl-sulfatase [Peptococcaceae bacterium]